MGLFTSKCVNPECVSRIRRGHKFCPKCGQGSPVGKVQCASCHHEMRASAKFCSYCGAALESGATPAFTSERWARAAGDFASRIDVPDVKGWLVKPLLVEHGTRALLFHEGVLVGEVTPGRYDMDGLLKRVGNLEVGRPTSIVLVDGGDVCLGLENGDLWTSDKCQVGTSLQLVVRVNVVDALFQNVIKGQARVLVDEIEEALAQEVQMVLAGLVGRFPAEALFPAMDARYEIEGELREHLRTTLSRLGLELVQLRFIDFVGEAYEELRQRQSSLQVDTAKTDVRAQRNILNQRIRELLTQDKMDAFSSEKDLGDFIRQTEHELGLKDVVREDELKRLGERFRFEGGRESVLRRLEIARIENDDRREQAWQQLRAEEEEEDERHKRRIDRELQTARSDEEKAKVQARIDETEHEQDLREARDGLDLLQKTKDLEQAELDRESERKLKELKAFDEVDARALVAILDGPAAERVTRLEEFRVKKELSPEQLLAIAAETNPAAAQPLAAKYAAEGLASAEVVRRLEQQVKDQREMSEGYADRMERIMQTGLEQMGRVASDRAESSQAPQVVGVPLGGGERSVAGASACSKCKNAIEASDSFCPQCGSRRVAE